MAAMGGPSPEDLLQQIRSLLDEYLALGSDTPVAVEAQNLAQAIDSAEPAPEEGGDIPPTEDMPVDSTQLMDGEEGYSGTDMGQARQGALDMLRNRNKKNPR